MHKESQVRLFERPFGALFWTQFLGAFNDNILKNALVILITYRSVTLFGMEPAMVVALSGAIFIAPYFFFSPFAGDLADRYDRAYLTRLTKVSEIVLMLFAALALSFESYPWLMVLLFLMGTQSTFFGPLKYGMLRDTVGEERLSHANAMTSAGTFVAILIGTMLGGALAAGGGGATLSLTLITVAVIGLLTARVVLPVPIHLEKGVTGSKSGHRNLWQLCLSRPGLLAHLLSISWFWLLGAVILSLLAPLTKDVFRADEWVSTFFLTLFTLGMGLGAVLAYRVGKGQAEVGLAAIMGIFMSLFLFDLAFIVSGHELSDESTMRSFSDFLLTFDGLRASFSLLFLSTAAGAYIVPLMTSVQLLARPSEISRVIAANNVLNAFFMILGSLILMALLAVSWSYQGILFFFGAINFLAATIVYSVFSPLTIRLWARFLTFIFFKVRLEGQELLPKSGPYIIVANHVSFIDWLLLMSLCPRPIRFIIDHQYYYAPMMPFWLKQAGLIPIATRRDGQELMEAAFDEVSKNLRREEVVGIFPEGALTRTGEMRPFQPGLNRILKRDPVPVVAVSLQGLWGSAFSHSPPGLFKKQSWLCREIYTVKVLKVIPPGEFQLRDIHRIIAESHQASLA